LNEDKPMQTTNVALEEHITALEQQMGNLQAELAEIRQQAQTPWWERLAGGFKDDPHFDTIIEAGKAYRRSLTPREC
jgi:hypothetical protein